MSIDLKKYNFDENLFNSLKQKYLDGQFNEDNNKVQGIVEPPDDSQLTDLKDKNSDSFKELAEIGIENLKQHKCGLIIANGGMATRFGGRVKGVIEVFDDMSFLELKLRNVKYINEKYGIDIPVYIMNSFATDEKTKELLEEKKYFGLNKNSVHCFFQYISIRLNKDGSVLDSDSKYYGPGHGDVYYAFKTSGMLQKFTNNSGKYLLYSNVDNLGAVIDPAILGFHIKNNYDMTVELAEKYKGDKGGAPALVDGKLQIVEGFKFPDDFNQDSITVFNTATYVFSSDIFDKNIDLPWYLVNKKVEEKPVIQFEHLAGDLSMYLNTGYVVIDRKERFYPIKTVEDLENSRIELKQRLADEISVD